MTRTLKELLSSEDKVVVKHADSRAKTIIELIGAEDKTYKQKLDKWRQDNKEVFEDIARYNSMEDGDERNDLWEKIFSIETIQKLIDCDVESRTFCNPYEPFIPDREGVVNNDETVSFWKYHGRCRFYPFEHDYDCMVIKYDEGVG
jgi:hypothetical protein